MAAQVKSCAICRPDQRVAPPCQQDMHGIELTVPARPGERPDRDSLAARFEGFGV